MRPNMCLVAFGLIISACSTPQETNTASLESKSTPELWALYNADSFNRDMLYTEAVLASRGAHSFGNSYLGQRTSGNVGKKSFTRSPATGGTRNDLKNCNDFSTPLEAQKYFLTAGGPASDPNNLDSDGDGFACEWGKTVQRSAVAYRPKPKKAVYRSKPMRSTSRVCHTGPRGGRYYYSSSGRKVYGC